MKIQQIRGVLFLLPLVTTLVFTSCNNNKIGNSPAGHAPEQKDPLKRMTDIKGAMEYEFNMIKNPVTGDVPAGTRDLELQQAKQIWEEQERKRLLSGTLMDGVNAYTFQGPDNMGGRTRAVVYDVRNGTSNSVILAGGVSGGIFKSTDNGATWVRKGSTTELFSVSALAQDTRASFRDTWYYAGGEFTGNSAGATGASYRGRGVYKSTDNGETWTFQPASNTGVYESFDHRMDYVVKLVVDPTNGNVYAAAMDAIYRSTDGGTTWTNVLTSGSAGYGTGMPTDIVVTSGGRFYAAFAGTNNTTPTNMCGVWTSTTGASGSWTKIAGTGAASTPAGWQADGTYGRVVLALAPSLETTLYAMYWNGISYTCGAPAAEADLFRWDFTTSTWTDLSANMPDETGCSAGNDPFAVQTGYDLVIAVKPDDANTVFIGGTNIYRSTNGFTSTAATTRIGGYAGTGGYGIYTNSHPDIHSIAFAPTSATTMLCGNDGGVQRTTDIMAATVSWTDINVGFRTYQFYYVDIDPRIGNPKVMGGAQDNGSVRNVSGTGVNFERAWGGDGVSVGLSDLIAGTQYEYVGSQAGFINRRTAGTAIGFSTGITPTGETNSGLFVTLFKLDPDNSERLYYANDNALYRTTSASTVTSGTWTSMTGVATSVGAANDITALATTRGTYSAATSSLFMGTSNGRVYRLDDPTGVAAATAPVDITGGSFPGGAYISSIAVNPRNDDTVMVTMSNYGIAGLWWTGNANAASPTWTNVEGALTLPSFRSCAIHAVPNSPEVQYYVGTSVGLYRSGTTFPATPAWTQEGASSIGNAVVSSISLRPSDGYMLAGTHGYGMWLTPLSLFPLPVILTDFSGTLVNNKTALLQWKTSSEYDSKHFELEKSIDGINFRKIATIPAAGNSSSPRNYSYTDTEPLTEKNYYRLRSVDLNNSSRLTEIVLLKLDRASQDMVVLGNPFSNELVIRFVKPAEQNGELRLTDVQGRLIMVRNIGKGEQVVRLSALTSRMAPGTYFVQAVFGNNIYKAKAIKE